MLTVKVYLDKSKIHGIGVFAAEDVKRGHIIWTYVEGFDQILDAAVVAKLPEMAQAYLKRYSFKENGKIYLTMDHDRFINHSDDANTKSLPSGDVITIRDIKKDEEITMNYTEFGAAWDIELPDAPR